MRFAALLLALASCSCGSRTGLVLPDTEDAAIELDAAACSPATCRGCCDDAGSCQPGTALGACGLGGAACQACNPLRDVCNPTGGGTHVEGVVCWAPCDFVKGCQAGCCTPSGDCLPGDSDESCGTTIVCQDCAQAGKTCQAIEGLRRCR